MNIMNRVLLSGFTLLVGLQQLAVAKPTGRPNILFAIADDMSHASIYGYRFLKTPNFDRIGEKGIVFGRAYTPSSKCSPSRSVIITGRNPWQLEAAANHQPVFPLKFKSVFESINEHGYFVGFTGKGWGPGNSQGRDMLCQEFNNVKVAQVTTGISDCDYSENFREFLDAKPADKPFLFWFGCKEPHRKYQAGSGKKAGKNPDDLDFLPAFWGDSDRVRRDILDYALEVEHYDMHLGRILDILKEGGELENTLVIATSDNGMPFPRYKGHPYDFGVRIPMVASWPGKIKNPGRTCEDYVSFIDLAPTFLDAVGITLEQSGMQAIQGKSLADIFSNAPTERSMVLTGRERNDIGRPHDQGYPVRALHKGRFVYMHNFKPERWPCGNPETKYRDTDSSPTKTFTLKKKDSILYEKCYAKRPPEELYDIKADPDCMNNLALNPEYAEQMQSMKTELFTQLKIQGDPRMHGYGDIFDSYKHSRAPGYYEKTMAKRARGKAKSASHKMK